MTIDVLYLTWNRLAFTAASFETLCANTEWELVRRLIIRDDGSDDGTLEHLEWTAQRDVRLWDTEVIIEVDKKASAPAYMNDYVASGSGSDWFAKVDNDILLPPSWLSIAAGVIERYPMIELLGMEAGQTRMIGRDGWEWDGVYRFEPATNIGGVGLMRTESFLRRPSIRASGRFGFTEWQHKEKPTRGWVTPDLAVLQLDRMPMEPWASLSRTYIERGWQREWPAYDEKWAAPYWECYDLDHLGGIECGSQPT